MNDTDKGVIWYFDDEGAVRKGRLIDCDPLTGLFWVWLGCVWPQETDVVVILKNGQTFSSGKSEWCGRLRLKSVDSLPADPAIGCYAPVPGASGAGI